MEFKVKTEPEYGDFYTWNRLYRDKIMKAFTGTTKKLLILCEAILVFIAVKLIMLRTLPISFVVIVVLFGVFCWYFYSAYKLYSKWGLWYYKKLGFSEASFNASGIVCKYAKDEKKIDYSDIKGVYRSEDCFYVMPKRSVCIILPKKGFAENEFDAFTAFIEKMTGIGVLKVN